MNDDTVLKLIGEFVRDHRLQRGHSQRSFAIRVGLGAQTIRFFEKGHRWPGESVRLKIEEGLGWRQGSITEFRERAHAASGLHEVLMFWGRIVPGSSPVIDATTEPRNNGATRP